MIMNLENLISFRTINTELILKENIYNYIYLAHIDKLNILVQFILKYD